MADLNELNSTIAVKIVGADSAGSETNFANVTVGGGTFSNLRNATGVELLGPQTMANSLPVTFASNQDAILITPEPVGATIDAFGSLRVSQIMILGAYNFANSPHSLSFNSLLTTGGTFTHVPASSSIRLTTTTASGSQAVYQGRRYHRYNPGESHRLTVATPFGAAKTNVTKRVGLFDALDGLFLEQTGTDVAFVVRSSTSGSAVDTRVTQANWNVDKFDGTGPSGLTLNLSFHNIFFVDYSWHGAGRVRFGFFINGRIYYGHNALGGNTQVLPWTRTPLFPFRFEITNTGATASATNLDIVACHFSKESTDDIFVSNAFSRSSVRTGIVAGATLLPLISIRPKLLFSGIVNRVAVHPKSAQVMSNINSALCQVYINPTLTGGTWVSVDAASAVEFNQSATAITGGTLFFEFYIANNAETSVDLKDLADQITLGLNIAGTVADILTIAVISTGSNATNFGTISWQEYQ